MSSNAPSEVRSSPWHHFDSLDHERETTTLGMWAFLATECLFFGALFLAFTVFRWLYPESFEAGSARLNLLIGGVNTVVLLTSSFTMALAVRAARLDHARALAGLLAATGMLGLAFLALKAVEYAIDYHEQLVPGLAFEPSDWPLPADARPVQLFLILYYVMTGLHAIHMLVGIVVMAALAVLAHRGAFSVGHDGPVEMWGLYWHFVDVVWLFLLPLLYLSGTRTH